MADGGEQVGGDQPRYDVFISFARPSGRDDALALRDALLGLKVAAFVDEKGVPGGWDWERELRRAQRSSRMSLVIVTMDLLNSDHQRTEVLRAVRLKKGTGGAHRIVPWWRPGGPQLDDWVQGLELNQAVTGGVAEVAADVAKLIVEGTAYPAVSDDLDLEETDGSVAGARLLLQAALDLCTLAQRAQVATVLGCSVAALRDNLWDRAPADVVHLMVKDRRGLPTAEWVERRAVLVRLLPYLRGWAHVCAQLAEGRAEASVDLPVFHEWVVELMLAGRQTRSVALRPVGRRLVPTHGLRVSPSRRAYRESPAVEAALLVQAANRRVGSLLEAMPELKQVLSGLYLDLGGAGFVGDDVDAAVDGLQGRLRAEARRGREWFLLIEAPRDGETDLWEIAQTLTDRLPALRVVRFGGPFGATGDLRGVLEEVENLLCEELMRDEQ